MQVLFNLPRPFPRLFAPGTCALTRAPWHRLSTCFNVHQSPSLPPPPPLPQSFGLVCSCSFPTPLLRSSRLLTFSCIRPPPSCGISSASYISCRLPAECNKRSIDRCTCQHKNPKAWPAQAINREPTPLGARQQRTARHYFQSLSFQNHASPFYVLTLLLIPLVSPAHRSNPPNLSQTLPTAQVLLFFLVFCHCFPWCIAPLSRSPSVLALELLFFFCSFQFLFDHTSPGCFLLREILHHTWH